jgi:hypothetical protein
MSNVVLSLVVLLAIASPGETPEASAPANETICERDIRADMFFLASDAFRGRLTASPGNALAADFVASRLTRLGLKPMGPDGSYFQPFLLSTATLGPDNRLELDLIPSPILRVGKHFSPLPFAPSASSAGPVIFAGFGISDPARNHDDYRDLNVAAQIVLVLNHEPGEHDPASPFDGLVASEAGLPLRKALTAQEKGAAGILFVSDVHNHPGPENFEAMARGMWPEKPPTIPAYTLEDWVERVHIPAAIVSTSTARRLLGIGPEAFEELAKSAEKGPAWQQPTTRSRSWIKKLTTDVNLHIVPDRNILAAIEGSGPELKDEWVIVSSHPDHNGADGNRIYNGADDNASGTVGMLEIAEAYALAAQQGHRPKRSVLFASFNSEERGLLGSYAFVERPPIPLSKIVAVLNMDMIGRNEEVPEGGGARFRGLPVQTAESNRNAVNLLGYSRTPSLTKVVERANAPFGLTLKQVLDNNASNLLRRSDQWPFLQRGVPALFIHTGLHPDYHTPADRPEKIEYAKMTRIVRLVHQASWDLANRPERPSMDGSGKRAP